MYSYCSPSPGSLSLVCQPELLVLTLFFRDWGHYSESPKLWPFPRNSLGFGSSFANWVENSGEWCNFCNVMNLCVAQGTYFSRSCRAQSQKRGSQRTWCTLDHAVRSLQTLLGELTELSDKKAKTINLVLPAAKNPHQINVKAMKMLEIQTASGWR